MENVFYLRKSIQTLTQILCNEESVWESKDVADLKRLKFCCDTMKII